MREAAFIKQNKDKWTKFESLITNNVRIAPDDLADWYLQITEDLSYAQTFYPNSHTTDYLNMLASRAHLKLYKTKKESSSRLWRFYSHDFPKFFYQYQKQLLLSFVIFLMFALIGVLSAWQDDSFARVILGNAYVDMTIENIHNGSPMEVYKQGRSSDMFLGITLNNIQVALMAFVYGILLGVGTLYIIMNNAVMVGVFQFFFFQFGMGWESIRTIWIHGAFEISVIIIAGAAGLVVGRSLLFPGTYSRLKSFTKGVKDGLKIVISTIPFFICAGFLESYVTRHTEMSDFLAVFIILISFGIIVFYYVFYPRYLHKKQITHAATRIN